MRLFRVYNVSDIFMYSEYDIENVDEYQFEDLIDTGYFYMKSSWYHWKTIGDMKSMDPIKNKVYVTVLDIDFNFDSLVSRSGTNSSRNMLKYYSRMIKGDLRDDVIEKILKDVD